MRDQYPPDLRYGPKGQDSTGFRPLAAYATSSLPGTPEKIAVMQQRALARLQLFHPQDATFGQAGWKF